MSANYLSPGCWAPALVALSLAALANAAEPTLPRDGWVTWQVPAVAGAPAWCCWRTVCRLDGGADGFGVQDGQATTDVVKVYARSSGGKIDRLQALAASCPVETRTPVQALDGVSAEESVHWLASQVKQPWTDAVSGRSIGEAALAALALHRGDPARDTVANFARHGDPETRKWSVFWLALLRGAEGADLTSAVMFADPEPEVREHATFALTQSKSPRVTQDLIRLGNTDKSAEVRAKAWFWLAQTAATEAEQAIGAAVKADPDEHVREQAIFALSRLPDERGTHALIAVAEDRTLAREQRRRAVFWLSQSDSDSARLYLESVLARNR